MEINTGSGITNGVEQFHRLKRSRPVDKLDKRMNRWSQHRNVNSVKSEASGFDRILDGKE